MKAFRIYALNTNINAVPMGFNIAAFLTSFLWAAANGLWGRSFILFLGIIFLAATVYLGFWLEFKLLSLVALIGLALLPVWAGMQAQHWLCQSLDKKGFKLIARLTSQSMQTALMTGQEMVSKANKIKQAAAAKKAPSNQPDAKFGKDFRDIRDKTEANANQVEPTNFNQVPAWRKNR